MRRLPSFHGLRAFESAARLGSFAQASGELHLTPSAISHQIRGLEEHFGRLLFHRHGRRVEPTAEGRRLLERLTRTLDELEAACAELRGAPRPLRVHCAPSLASEWLGPRLLLLMREQPALTIQMSASAEPVDLIRREDEDVSIVYGAPPARAGLEVEPLGTELVAALVAPSLAGRPIEGLTLIESRVNPVRWEDWFAHNGLPAPGPGAGPSFDRAAMAIAAAVQGAGAALESTRVAQARLHSGELVALPGTEPVPRTLHFLCYRTAQRDEPALAAFRAWLLEEIRRSDASP